MFEIADKIKDNIKDEAWPYLVRLNKRTSWNDESKQHLEELKIFLKNKNYISFVGHPNRYHLTQIGDSSKLINVQKMAPNFCPQQVRDLHVASNFSKKSSSPRPSV